MFLFLCMVAAAMYLFNKEVESNKRTEQVAREAALYGDLKSCAVALTTTPTTATNARNLLDHTVLPLAQQTEAKLKARFTIYDIATPEEIVAELAKCRTTAAALQDLVSKLQAKELAEKRVATLARIQGTLKVISEQWGFYRLPPIDFWAMRTRLPCMVAREIASLGTDIRSYPDPIWQQVMAVEPWNRRISDCLR